MYYVKGWHSSSWEGTPPQSYGTSLAIWDHQCYLPPDTSECIPRNPSNAGWYL